MKLKLIFAASACHGAVACRCPAAPPAPDRATAAPAAAAETPHDRLFRLFKESDEAQLKRNPLFGIFRGDLRYADQFGDYITDAYYAGESAAAEADLAALHAIDRASLDADRPAGL